MNPGEQCADEKGAKDSSDTPGKIQECDGCGGVSGGELRAAQIDGGSGQAVAKTIHPDHQYGDVPWSETEKDEG